MSNAAACATTGVFAPQRIYVIGGNGVGSLEGTQFTQVYNPENDSWTTGALMPVGRLGLTAAVVNDQIYAIGGSTLAVFSEQLNLNEQYTPLGYGKPDTPAPSISNFVTIKQESFIAIFSCIIVLFLVGVGLAIYFRNIKLNKKS